MKTQFVIALGPALGGCVRRASAPARSRRMRQWTKAGCMACHTKDKKLVGPSLQEIAAKYKGQDVVPTLMQKGARRRRQGNFGPIPMAPNPPDKINDADLKEAVEYILKN